MLKSIKNRVAKVGVVLGSVVASGAAMAGDYTTEIAQAQTEAVANQSAVIGAVIMVAVVGFGAAAIVAWMRR